MLKEGVDWDYIIPEDKDTTINIKLLSGEYKDVVYQYGKVRFEEGEDGAAYLSFVYNIVETSLDKEVLENNVNFKNKIGDILVTILESNLNKGMLDEVGTDYSEESDS